MPVVLQPYQPDWPTRAEEEAARLHQAIGTPLIVVHHIGSTAIPGMLAKPILDLIPVFQSLDLADRSRVLIEQLGYKWWGENGLPGRRYCTLDDPQSGRRIAQLHCYALASPEIDRHLAFRDYLRARPDVAQAYADEKARCRALHPLNSHAYTECKSDWIQRVEREARCVDGDSDLL
ncbi:MAG: GrpB family protein [Planctomycetaceae bacterium]|nr:GrpB family protein [Planctomycetaceae bacterium]